MPHPTSEIRSPAAWRGAEIKERDNWIYRLSGEEVEEIKAALSGIGNRPLHEVTAADFPLPRLSRATATWVDELERGRGFVLVRGVPVDGKSVDECSLIYWGIGAHIGTPVSQNAAGDLLGHVRDTGADPTDPSVRLYKTRKAQPFHTDGADIIGLLCLRAARRGGASQIVSSVSIFNEIRRRRHDLVPLCFEPFPFDRNEEQAPGESPFFEFPLCAFDGEHLRTFYIGWYIRDSQRHRDAPRLTAQQHELIDLIDEIAARPDFHLEMDFQPGDIQLLKNSTILHARAEYDDYDDPKRKRHLLRLWLTGHRDMAGGDELLRGGIPKKQGSTSDSETL